MSWVSGVPNFYAGSSPSYADFNLIHRLIVQQIGGTAPGASSEYATFPGHLSPGGNVVAVNPGFRNHQKVEARSIFTMDAGDQFSAAGLICGPVPFDCEAFALGIINDDAAKITGGTVTVFVNGVSIITISVPPCASANQMTGVSVRLQLRTGDVFHITQALTFDAGTNHSVRFTLYCTALQVAA